MYDEHTYQSVSIFFEQYSYKFRPAFKLAFVYVEYYVYEVLKE